jgi:catechol-2,3-dioxygenase
MPSELLKPMASEHQPQHPIDPGARIGHIHLKVADLDQARFLLRCSRL